LHSAEFVKGCQASHIVQIAVDAEVSRVEALLHRKTGVKAANILSKVKVVMWNKVGIIRDAEKLQSAHKEIKQLQNEAQLLYAEDIAEQQACLEVQDMLRTAEVIILAAIERKESRGAHYRSDYPQLDAEWKKNIRVYKDIEGKLVIRSVSLVKE
jgi:succinate dehydrogenase / fumarate reductase flavoprotein subunit